jgi:hypothetical protein
MYMINDAHTNNSSMMNIFMETIYVSRPIYPRMEETMLPLLNRVKTDMVRVNTTP